MQTRTLTAMPPSLARSLLTARGLSRGPTCLRQRTTLPPTLSPSRCASSQTKAKSQNKVPGGLSADKRKQAVQVKKAKKRQAERVQWKRDPIERGIFFPLVDAMRYIRAFEAGYPGESIKYDLAINLKTDRSGATVKSGIRLPNRVDSSVRIAVICPPDSKAARDAKAAGASVVGEDSFFEDVKNGKMEFERCLCHISSLSKLEKAGVGRYLGPKGLMPNPKAGTIVTDVRKAIKALTVGTQFRERAGVIRAPIGRLNYTPEQLQTNIKALMGLVTQKVEEANLKGPKEIHDVVLSSTHSPGIPLSGMLMDENSPDSADLKERSLQT